MNSEGIFFNRLDYETCALAKLHCSLRHQIENSPFWQKEDVPDIPLTEEQMIAFIMGYFPDWECRYAPYMVGSWFYITRSGHWLKKFKYKLRKDGYYHITEHYTTEKEKGRNLLMEVIAEGYFNPTIFDERLEKLYEEIYKKKNTK